MRAFQYLSLVGVCVVLCQCAAPSPPIYGAANMRGPLISVEQREAEIAKEPTGDFFYGRRYYVNKTRFWGYLREPRQSASKAKLVMFRENLCLNPDRLPEDSSTGNRYGFDHNFEYRIYGKYTGETAYDPNSNQTLPVFLLTKYELVNPNPGWLFYPSDHYDPNRITLFPSN